MPLFIRSLKSLWVFSGLWPFLTSSAVMSSMPNQIARRPPSRAQGQQVGSVVHIELGRLGAEEDGIAEGLAMHLALHQDLEDLLDGFAVIEEVVVRAQERVDAGALGQPFELVDGGVGDS